MKRTLRKPELAALGLVTLALLAIPASGSTFLAVGQDELVKNSDAVIEGTVLKVESSWDTTGRVIISEALIQVRETVTGKSLNLVRVQTFGGQVGDYNVVAHGFPVFEPGDEVLLFVNRREALDGSLRVTGYQLGHYLIVERDGVKMAEPTVEHDVNFVPPRGQQKVAPPKAQPLAELKAQIVRLAAEAKPSN